MPATLTFIDDGFVQTDSAAPVDVTFTPDSDATYLLTWYHNRNGATDAFDPTLTETVGTNLAAAPTLAGINDDPVAWSHAVGSFIFETGTASGSTTVQLAATPGAYSSAWSLHRLDGVETLAGGLIIEAYTWAAAWLGLNSSDRSDNLATAPADGDLVLTVVEASSNNSTPSTANFNVITGWTEGYDRGEPFQTMWLGWANDRTTTAVTVPQNNASSAGDGFRALSLVLAPGGATAPEAVVTGTTSGSVAGVAAPAPVLVQTRARLDDFELFPGAVTPGNLLVAAFGVRDGDTGASSDAVPVIDTMTSGWNLIGVNTPMQYHFSGIAWRVADGTAADDTFQVTYTDLTNSPWTGMAEFSLAGVSNWAVDASAFNGSNLSDVDEIFSGSTGVLSSGTGVAFCVGTSRTQDSGLQITNRPPGDLGLIAASALWWADAGSANFMAVASPLSSTAALDIRAYNSTGLSKMGAAVAVFVPLAPAPEATVTGTTSGSVAGVATGTPLPPTATPSVTLIDSAYVSTSASTVNVTFTPEADATYLLSWGHADGGSTLDFNPACAETVGTNIADGPLLVGEDDGRAGTEWVHALAAFMFTTGPSISGDTTVQLTTAKAGFSSQWSLLRLDNVGAWGVAADMVTEAHDWASYRVPPDVDGTDGQSLGLAFDVPTLTDRDGLAVAPSDGDLVVTIISAGMNNATPGTDGFLPQPGWTEAQDAIYQYSCENIQWNASTTSQVLTASQNTAANAANEFWGITLVMDPAPAGAAPEATVTGTTSGSVAGAATAAAAADASPVGTLSASVAGSATGTAGVVATVTGTLSASVAGTATGTAGVVATATGTLNASTAGTVTGTAAADATVTGTVSASTAGTATAAAGVTATATGTVSASVAGTVTGTSGTTATVTGATSASVAGTVTGGATSAATVTGTTSASVSGTASVSVGATAFATGTVTASTAGTVTGTAVVVVVVVGTISASAAGRVGLTHVPGILRVGADRPSLTAGMRVATMPTGMRRDG